MTEKVMLKEQAPGVDFNRGFLSKGDAHDLREEDSEQLSIIAIGQVREAR
jgi:hypothetical protein